MTRADITNAHSYAQGQAVGLCFPPEKASVILRSGDRVYMQGDDGGLAVLNYEQERQNIDGAFTPATTSISTAITSSKAVTTVALSSSTTTGAETAAESAGPTNTSTQAVSTSETVFPTASSGLDRPSIELVLIGCGVGGGLLLMVAGLICWARHLRRSSRTLYTAVNEDASDDAMLELVPFKQEPESTDLTLHGSTVADASQTDINGVDERGQTRLHRAVLQGRPRIVKELMEHPDFDPAVAFAWDKRGYAPIHWACLTGDSDIILTMLDAMKTTADIDGVFNSKQRLLLAHTTMQKQSLLHLAVKENNALLLYFLLKLSPLLRSRAIIPDQMAELSPIELAREMGLQDCIQVFDDNGCLDEGDMEKKRKHYANELGTLVFRHGKHLLPTLIEQ